MKPHYIIYTYWDGKPYMLENIHEDFGKLLTDLHEGHDRFPGREDGCAAKILYINLDENEVTDVTKLVSDKLGEMAVEERRVNPDFDPHPLARDYVFDVEMEAA